MLNGSSFYVALICYVEKIIKKKGEAIKKKKKISFVTSSAYDEVLSSTIYMSFFHLIALHFMLSWFVALQKLKKIK